jgi:predicted GIY-YIG superfamily endonuclease
MKVTHAEDLQQATNLNQLFIQEMVASHGEASVQETSLKQTAKVMKRCNLN